MTINASNCAIADVQSRRDQRRLAINKVGIRDYAHPITIRTRDGELQHTTGRFSMGVCLDADLKGTHMSRFIDMLSTQIRPLTFDTFKDMLKETTMRLQSRSSYIDIDFAYFILKKAPISKISSYLNYDVSLRGQIQSGQTSVALKVVVPVTSLCPCSKEISNYGAHNQRSLVSITAECQSAVAIEDLVELIEKQASCELYSSLKREDEKFVTEHAYNNPKFVEDTVRDIAIYLNNDERITHYIVESENFESIHNHSAYAMIEKARE